MVLPEHYYAIGIDGGGTKTEALLIDQDRNVIASGKGGSVNGRFAAEHIIHQSVRDAICPLEDAVDMREVLVVGACVMGGLTETEDLLRRIGFDGQLYYFSEPAVAARRAGLRTRRGITAVAGTGSSFCASDGEKRYATIGGWGIGVGDEGSGFDIGLNAIKAAGRAWDGRGPETILLDMLLKEAGVESFSHLLPMYCYPSLRQREIASLAKVVATAANLEDGVAIRILSQAGDSLGSDIVHVGRKIFCSDEEFDIGLSGGVFNSGDFVMRPLTARVLSEFPKARIHLPEMSPGMAVALLALERYKDA